MMNHLFPRRRMFCWPSARRVLLAGLLVCGCLAASPGRAQSLWEVSPYRIEVWIALEPHPRVDPNWQQRLPDELRRLAVNRIGAVWSLEARPAPEQYLGDLLRSSPLDLEQLKEQQRQLVNQDKLMLLLVQDDPAGYRLSLREVDLSTRQWSATQSVTVAQSDLLAQQALDLMCDVFVPVVRIERVEETSIIASVRGGALVRPEQSTRRWQVPTSLQVGDVLQPILLRTDRNGQVGPDGVKPIEWTVLIVNEVNGSVLTCDFQSGYRQPFNTRRSSRVQQLAYRVKPRHSATTLRLVNRRSPDEPLVGYQVYSRPPGDDEQLTELIGRTDWRGELTVERNPQQPVQVLFVRNGQQLLGKLPFVPGDQPLRVAPLRNDDLRLEAEGFLLGVQDSLVDLVARREVLAARIRKAIEAGEIDQADGLLRELRRLDTQDDFARRVQQRKQTLSSADAQVQQKIDELFAQTRSLLGKYLSQDQVDQLSRSLDAARQSAPK
jgi:hypothetical protein